MPSSVACRLALATALVTCAGCGLLLDLDPDLDAEGATDAGDPLDTGTDGRAPVMDSGMGPVDADILDAAVTDVGPGPMRAPMPPCGEVDSFTLALYRMEETAGDALFEDATGRYDGLLEGPDYELGACGNAMRSRHDNYGLVEPIDVTSRAGLRLEEGAIDMWVKVRAGTGAGCRHLFSRDAVNTAQAGHLTISHDGAGRIGVRLQGGGSLDVPDLWIYSDADVPEETWTHVGVNFGAATGLELYIDGDPQVGAPREAFPSCAIALTPTRCMSGCTLDISGNDNPFVVGIGMTASGEGIADVLSAGFSGALDDVRISTVPRDFRTIVRP